MKLQKSDLTLFIVKNGRPDLRPGLFGFLQVFIKRGMRYPVKLQFCIFHVEIRLIISCIINSLSLGLLCATKSARATKSVVIYFYFAILFKTVFVFFQEPYKHESTNALVAITEGVIFYYKIQKVCCLLFDTLV